MNTLPVLLLLAIEHSVLVTGEHLSLGGHGLAPDLEALERLAALGERRLDRRDYRVDGPQTLPLAGLLELREAPGVLPISSGTVWLAKTVPRKV